MTIIGGGGWREGSPIRAVDKEAVPVFVLDWHVEDKVVEVYWNTAYKGANSEFRECARSALKELVDQGFDIKSIAACSVDNGGDTNSLLIVVE